MVLPHSKLVREGFSNLGAIEDSVPSDCSYFSTLILNHQNHIIKRLNVNFASFSYNFPLH